MSDFDDLIEDVNAVCVDALGDDEGTLTDGVVAPAEKAGFFREQFEQVLADRYQFTKGVPTFECAESALDGLDRSRIKSKGWKYRPADRAVDYTVLNVLGPTKGMVLLELVSP